MGKGKPAFGISKKLTVKTINEQDKKDLKTLAYDFGCDCWEDKMCSRSKK